MILSCDISVRNFFEEIFHSLASQLQNGNSLRKVNTDMSRDKTTNHIDSIFWCSARNIQKGVISHKQSIRPTMYEAFPFSRSLQQ